MSKLTEARNNLDNILTICTKYRYDLTKSQNLYHQVESTSSRDYKSHDNKYKNDIEKSLSFDLTTSYKTLANRFYKVCEAVDTSIFERFRSNYVRYDDLNYLLVDIKSTIGKLDEIIEFIELHDDIDDTEIQKNISKYVNQIINKVKKVLEQALSGCKWRLERIEVEFNEFPEKKVWLYIVSCIFWTPSSVIKTKEKSLGSTVALIIVSILTTGLGFIVGGIYGLITLYEYNKYYKLTKLKKRLEYEFEKERIQNYSEILN